MAIYSYFYDSVDNDRPYSAGDFARAFGMIMYTGVIPANDTGAFGFGIGGTNYTTISEGRAVVEGHFVEVTDSETITPPAGTYSGMVVIRVDMTDARTATISVRQDRSPQKDAAVYELPLWNVSVTNGVISSVIDVREKGGAVAKTADNVPTWYADPNGVVLKIRDHEIFFTAFEPANAPHRVWIQTVN